MNPVIGLDVSKGASQVRAFLDKANLIVKALVLFIILKGLGNLLDFLHEVKALAGGHQPSVVLK